MRFRVEQTFRAPPEDVARAYADPSLYALLGALPRLGDPDVVEHREDGDRVELAVRYRFAGDLSGAVRRVIDPARLTWVEHAVHDLARRVTDIRIVPDHYADRLRASAVATVTPAGSGTRRVTEGEVLVTGVPLVGGAAERAIVSGISQHLTAHPPLVERHLAGG